MTNRPSHEFRPFTADSSWYTDAWYPETAERPPSSRPASGSLMRHVATALAGIVVVGFSLVRWAISTQ